MRSQGRFGANYSVNGHRTSGERRVDFNKGYSFLFERCFEENTLEEIEKIDWSHVTVKTLDANYPPCSLPEGYSFVVKDIQYIKCYDSFEVTIEVDKQYWGDVTPYQAQIAELTAASEAKDSELSEKNALIAEKAQQIAQKDSKIAEMADAEQAAKILILRNGSRQSQTLRGRVSRIIAPPTSRPIRSASSYGIEKSSSNRS